MTKVLILNGNRPRSGKGTCAKILSEWAEEKGYSYQTPEFKDKLIKMSAEILGVSTEEFLTDYDRQTPDKVWWMKDLVSISTSANMKKDNGKALYSQREWLIHVSENVVKPNFGEDYFGKALAKSISPTADFAFVADGGFVAEIEAVVQEVGLGNVLVVSLYRDVKNPVKDSRKLLKSEDFHWTLEPDFVKVENNGTIEELKQQLMEKVVPWLES